MTENARKVFDMLGIEPCVWFRVDGIKEKIYINEDLIIEDEEGFFRDKLLRPILTGQYKIIKLPKKKHVGDLKCYEFENCMNCPVRAINPYCKEEYSLYDNLEEYNDEIQDSELYDFLKKRLDEEVKNDK